jgi:hypothetical protein
LRAFAIGSSIHTQDLEPQAKLFVQRLSQLSEEACRQTKKMLVNKRTGQEEHKTVPMLRYYYLFNLEQTEGIADPLLDAINI